MSFSKQSILTKRIIMARIIDLKITNFRGIQNLNFSFNVSLICLIGRGDSGKTTILDAIHAVLNPTWNAPFYDTDFFNCDLDNTIRISATLVDLPQKLLMEDRYGLFIRGYDEHTGKIHDTPENHHKRALTIRLTVDKSLEPKWEVVSGNEQGEKAISATDRGRLNCFKVADYVDSHFSWNKGTPLYSLLRTLEEEQQSPEASIILEALRSAKKAIDEDGFENLSDTTEAIVSKAATLGMDISNASTTIDVKDLAVRDGKVCLHDDKIPFRLKGKGSKRLASMAIQSALAQKGGIMLIDEIEQGLEPDRIANLVRTLKDENEGQIFLTTHSRDAICELEVSDLRLVLKDKDDNRTEEHPLNIAEENLKKAVRSCPEAFFAKKIIVCEGKTEIGICRALDAYRKKSLGKPPMSFKDCAYVLGAGDDFVIRAKMIKKAGFDAAVFCDSDKPEVNGKKTELKELGVKTFDCADEHSIEKQVFKDLPWKGVQQLLDYIISDKYQTKENLESALKNEYSSLPKDWWNSHSDEETKTALSKISNQKNEWFKRIDHGQKLGEIIFGCFDEMNDEIHLKKMLTDLSDWIDR